MTTVLTCKKCGKGANNAIVRNGIMVSKTGGATLRIDGDKYVCEVCDKRKNVASRKVRRATK